MHRVDALSIRLPPEAEEKDAHERNASSMKRPRRAAPIGKVCAAEILAEHRQSERMQYGKPSVFADGPNPRNHRFNLKLCNRQDTKGRNIAFHFGFAILFGLKSKMPTEQLKDFERGGKLPFVRDCRAVAIWTGTAAMNLWQGPPVGTSTWGSSAAMTQCCSNNVPAKGENC